ETREQEMVLALDALRQERQALKDKIDRLLVGVRSFVTTPSRSAPPSSDGVLEPREIQPYIPFCFPDRLPSQLKPQWARTKRLPIKSTATTPVSREPGAFLPPERKPLRQQSHSLSTSIPATLATPSVPFIPMFTHIPDIFVQPCVHRLICKPADRSLPPVKTSTTIELHLPILSILPEVVGRIVPPPIHAAIRTSSFAFFVAYLATTLRIVRQGSFVRLEHRLPVDRQQAGEDLLYSAKTITSRRVAIHTRSHLQFALLGPGRSEMVPDFPHGRLMFLLKTFGDSLTSMMSRLDDENPDADSGPRKQ
ncbi:MAG TPA: hypothetical protein PKM25_13485, partial [Candidatus Ozemobacteraceae bacterium]|nr:hypothetical protein [Candidatus Ozemobacteraceae bacterium]